MKVLKGVVDSLLAMPKHNQLARFSFGDILGGIGAILGGGKPGKLDNTSLSLEILMHKAFS